MAPVDCFHPVHWQTRRTYPRSRPRPKKPSTNSTISTTTTIVTISMDLPPFMEARESAPAQAGATRRLVWPLGRNYGARWAPLRHDGRSSFEYLAEADPVAGFRAARGGFHE